MERKIVAIHQPDFFPWLGFFDKLLKSDIFVINDYGQFSKADTGNWSNRVRLIVSGEPRWLTMPLNRTYKGLRKYYEIRIDNSVQWRKKLFRTIQINYGAAPHFKTVMHFLEPIMMNPSDSLVEYNLASIRKIAEWLEIDTSKLILGTTLTGLEGSKTDLIISVVKALDASAYMCGGGASGYQEDDKFPEHGLELIYQGFRHPQYEQFNSTNFVTGLSVIDALMNVGVEGTKRLLSIKQRLSI